MKEETLRQQVVRILPCHVAIKLIHQEEVVALVEETQIQAFNRGCESAQAKAEKAPPYLVYTIVSHDSVNGLGAAVQAMIESGWRPQGGVTGLRRMSDAASDYTFCQAMTRGGNNA